MTITSPSGKKYKVPGYFAADGNAGNSSATSGNKWRCHFTPLEKGSYSYKASFRTGTDIAATTSASAGSATSFDGDQGIFSIAVTDKSGNDFRSKGKLEYVGEHFLKWTTGEYFLKVGANSPEVFLEYKDFDNTPSTRTYSAHSGDWKSGDPTWKSGKGKSIIGVVNHLASKGMNVHYFLTMNPYGDGKKAYPWTGQDDYYIYDVSKLDQWQMVFDHMMKKGLMTHFVTTERENQSYFESKEGGSFAKSRKVYYRELVARFGYLNAITWNIGEENGWEKDGKIGKKNSTTQRKDFANYMKSLTYYNDLISIHNGPSGTDAIYGGITGHAGYSGAAYQGNLSDIKHGHDRVLYWRNQSARKGRKWVVSYDEPYTNNSKPKIADFRYKAIWASLTAGAAGVEFYSGGGKDLSIQNYKDYNEYWEAMNHARKFFLDNKVPFYQMASKDNLTSKGWCLAKEGSHYVVYLNKGGSANITVASGDYDVKWFDPRNGGSLKNGSVTKISGSGSKSVGNPPSSTSSEWVVLVAKQGTTTPPDPNPNPSCSNVTMLSKDFPYDKNKDFYLDDFTDHKLLAIDPNKRKTAEVSKAFTGETCTYDITLHAIGELDGESEFDLYVNNTKIGTHKVPLSTLDWEEGAKYNKTWTSISVAKGAAIKIVARVGTDGQEFARARWHKLEFNATSGGNTETKYSLTVNTGSGSGSFTVGSTVNISANTPPAGQEFDQWTGDVSAVSNVSADKTTITMPSSNISVTATYKKKSGGTGSCGADYQDKNGLVVVEAESLSLKGSWKKGTSKSGYSGTGYIYTTIESFKSPGKDVIEFDVQIDKVGTYAFSWNNVILEGSSTTDNNDTWLKITGVDKFYAKKGSSVVRPHGVCSGDCPNGAGSGGWFKIYRNSKSWGFNSSTSDNNPHQVYFDVSSPGVVKVQISARSAHHGIDRIIMYHSSVSKSDAQKSSNKETLCSGGSTLTKYVPVVSIIKPVANAYIDANSTVSITVSLDKSDSIAKVEYYNGTTKLGESSTSPFSFSWQPAKGNYSIIAKAIAKNGNSKVSEAITVNIGLDPPRIVAAINANGSTYTGTDGTDYSKDQYFIGGTGSSKTNAITGTDDDALFQRYRFGDMDYSIPVTNGVYNVTIKATEPFQRSEGKRVFDISMEGNAVETDIDLYKLTGDRFIAWEKTYDNILVNDGKLDINFKSSVDNALVSAIVVSRKDIVTGDTIEIEEASLKYVKAYPNPVQDILHIEAPYRVNYIMIDFIGTIVKSGEVSSTISVEELKSGMYILQLSFEDELKSFKVIKD